MAPYKNPVTVLLGQRVAFGALRTVSVLGKSEYTGPRSMGRIRFLAVACRSVTCIGVVGFTPVVNDRILSLKKDRGHPSNGGVNAWSALKSVALRDADGVDIGPDEAVDALGLVGSWIYDRAWFLLVSSKKCH